MTSLFLQNTGNLIVLLIILVITFSMLFLICQYQNPIIKDHTRIILLNFLNKRIKYRFIFACGYFIYGQVSFAALLQIFTWNLTSFLEIISMILAILSLTFSMLAPILLYRLISKHNG